MLYPDKFYLTQDLNRRFVRTNLARLIFSDLHFEKTNISLIQTQLVADGLNIERASEKDKERIIRLKRAWQYIINENKVLSLDIELKIHLLLTGYGFRDNLNYKQEEKFFDELMNNDTSTTDKAMTLMYHNMRNQLFWGGNKRTATLAANKLMIDHGAGLINAPLDKWDHWNKLISEYYLTGKMNTLKEWTYENGIQGVVLNNNSNLPKSDINPADYD